jgi:hypothetical protein
VKNYYHLFSGEDEMIARINVGSGIMVLLVVVIGLIGYTPQVTAAPAAQTGIPIRYGETVSGEITEAEPCVFYWFEGSAGDPVTIDMTRTSGSLDGVAALYQQDGSNFNDEPVAFNDDRPGGGLDPLIETTLPTTDWYTIAACRLQADQMRVTIGTFDLMLTGPAASTTGPTPTPGSSLSDSIFGGGATATPEPTAMTAIIAVTPTLDESGAATLLLDGDLVPGQLASGAADARYEMLVMAGDQVVIEWHRLAGNVAPLLRVIDIEGVTWAEATTPDPVSRLRLAFYVPGDNLLTVVFARSGDVVDNTFSDYELSVTITPGEPIITAVEPTATTEPGGEPSSDYLANPCHTGNAAIIGLGSTNRLIDVYTAAGDSYYVEELTRTTSFSADDDLNVVFLVQNVSAAVKVAAVFCAPNGDYYNAGESELEVGGPYLLGLDWESHGEMWEIGEAWFVELYVNGQVELTLGFAVE